MVFRVKALSTRLVVHAYSRVIWGVRIAEMRLGVKLNNRRPSTWLSVEDFYRTTYRVISLSYITGLTVKRYVRTLDLQRLPPDIGYLHIATTFTQPTNSDYPLGTTSP